MKGYISIFICMATRAVHIELVEDYSSEAFIAAFHRFTARRGHCKELYSDQGTNFVRADTQLRHMLSESGEFYSQVTRTFTQEGTCWKFNPPSAPHFGGLWEAAVKSAEFHIHSVIGEQVLTFSELSTLLCKAEACLNSRPLTALSDDPTDLQFLSPSHFLIQRSSFLVPAPDLNTIHIAVGKRWQLVSQMVQHFWSRWSSEYLTALQARQKWVQQQRSPGIGDRVLIRSELTPPLKWPLAQITALQPGGDGIVRVVSLRTATTTLRRPIVKLVYMPMSN